MSSCSMGYESRRKAPYVIATNQAQDQTSMPNRSNEVAGQSALLDLTP